MKMPIIMFETSEATTTFALDYYSEYVATLSKHEQNLIGSIQASGISVGDGRDDSIAAIEKCLRTCPPVPYDIVAWRAGKMSFTNRPFVSASLLKSTAMGYADNTNDVHKIIVKKGSKIFPLCALGQAYGDGEAEIIIATSSLHMSFFSYMYF